MKFGQDINENLVSEWRHQYLDYKKGKKKLKKLAKQAQSAESASHSRISPSLRGIFQNKQSPLYARSLNQRPTLAQGERSNLNLRPNFGAVSGVEPPTASLSSFQLPSPAIAFTSNENSSNIQSQNDQKQSKANDRTPLLLQSDPISNNGDSEVRRRQHSDVSTSYATRDPLDRSSVHRQSLPGDPYRDATELDDLVLFTKKEFIEWVDEELDKVDSFYREKENDCLSRFLILQDQIAQLRDQKASFEQRFSRITSQSHHNHNSDTYQENDSDSDSAHEDLDITSVISRHRIARNLRLYTFWTKRKLSLLNKLDTPSLPTFSWLHGNGKAEKQYYEEGYSDDSEGEEGESSSASRADEDMEQDPGFNRQDYSRKRHKQRPHKHVPYFQARRRLKEAMYEFYRSMELLKSYRLLNRTAFRKLIKKYDKTANDDILLEYMAKVDQSHFVKSDILETLLSNVEELFTDVFENGNRKIAVTKLRRKEGEETYYSEFFASGACIGLAIPLLVFAIYDALHKTINGTLPEGRYLLQIWGGFLMVNLMALLVGINCMIWDRYKVNYKFVFEFNTKDALDAKQYFLLPSLFLFALGFFAWFSFANLFPARFNGRDWPFMYFGMAIIIIFCPFDIFYLNARIWLVATMWRLIFSGFYPVEFRDFFVGDIFSSLTYSIGNLYTFICLYGSHWSGCLDGSGTTKCGSSTSRGMGFLSTVPSIWRLLQCFRRYADTGDWFPHLANMLKYFIATMYYMSLSLYRIETVVKYKALLITFGAMNSIFSGAWDLLMDWSLFQFNSENFLLRDELAFKRPWVYYVAMILNVILRFQWVFYALFSKQIQQSAVTSFCIGLAEVIRRWIWLLFRLENEHSTNVHLFRASRDTPLPYPVLLRRKIPRRPLSTRFDVPTDEEQPQPQQVATTADNDFNLRRHRKSSIPLPTAAENDEEVSIASIPSSIESDLEGELPLTYSPKLDTDTQSNNSVIPYPHPKYYMSDDRERAGSILKLTPIRSVSSAASRRTSLYQSPKSTNILENISRVLTNAHIKDFQRRKTEKVRYATNASVYDGSISGSDVYSSSDPRSYHMSQTGSGSGSGYASNNKSMQSDSLFQFNASSAGENDNENIDDDEEDDLDTDEDLATDRIRRKTHHRNTHN